MAPATHAGLVFEAWEQELIESTPRAVLGTVAKDGRPHLVPVCYALFSDVFVIAVDEKPKRAGELARVRNLRRDPRATLLIDRYDNEWTRLAWLRVDCLGTVLLDGKDEPGALAALRGRYAQYRAMDLESLPLIVLKPARSVSWRWQDGK
jgi:PPOX class probable F420-dependent enzyme